MLKVVPLRYGPPFKKAFSDHEVFSRFAGDILGTPIHVERVHQEYRFPEAVGAVNVTFDLFAEDAEHRLIIELQHVREDDFFDRFLHYHAVGIIEQAPSHAAYRPERTVYTIVVLTKTPREKHLRFSVAVSDFGPVNEQGERLLVYAHRLVFVNPKIINDKTPKAARAWMELIADSLDGEVEEARYTDPLMTRVLANIRSGTLTPEELEQVKEEAAWEQTKHDARLEGELEGKRKGRLEGKLEGKAEAVLAVLGARSVRVSDEARARILACQDVAALERYLTRALTAGSIDELMTE